MIMSEIETSEELNRVYNLFRHGATISSAKNKVTIDISETPYSQYTPEQMNSSGFSAAIEKGIKDLFHQCEVFDTENIKVSPVEGGGAS